MDLVCKDVGLFDKLTKKYQIPAEISSLIVNIFEEGRLKLGDRALSTSIIKLLEEKCNEELRANGFPSFLKDDKKKQKGEEVII
jgi:hypothetical protein